MGQQTKSLKSVERKCTPLLGLLGIDGNLGHLSEAIKEYGLIPFFALPTLLKNLYEKQNM